MQMGSANGTTPRFLLPKLTWKGILPEHQTAPARSFSAWYLTRNHRLLAIWRRNLLFGPSSAPSLAPSEPVSSLDSSRKAFWRIYSVSLSSFLVVPRPMSTLGFASRFDTNTKIIRRSFNKTQLLLRDHHFDTLKCVHRLKAEGFSEEQAKAMMLVLSEVIEESIQNLTRTMVLSEGLPPSYFLFYLFKYLY